MDQADASTAWLKSLVQAQAPPKLAWQRHARIKPCGQSCCYVIKPRFECHSFADLSTFRMTEVWTSSRDRCEIIDGDAVPTERATESPPPPYSPPSTPASTTTSSSMPGLVSMENSPDRSSQYSAEPYLGDASGVPDYEDAIPCTHLCQLRIDALNRNNQDLLTRLREAESLVALLRAERRAVISGQLPRPY